MTKHGIQIDRRRRDSYTGSQKGLDVGGLSGVRWDWVGMEWGKGMAGDEL